MTDGWVLEELTHLRAERERLREALRQIDDRLEAADVAGARGVTAAALQLGEPVGDSG